MPLLMIDRQQSAISCSLPSHGDPQFIVLVHCLLGAVNTSAQVLVSMARNGTGASADNLQFKLDFKLCFASYCCSNIRVKSDEEDWFALVIALLRVSEPSAGTCTFNGCSVVWCICVCAVSASQWRRSHGSQRIDATMSLDKDVAFVRWYDRPPAGDARRRCQRTNLERCKVVQEIRNRYGIVELASIRGAVHITPDYRCDGFYLVNTYVDTLSHKHVRKNTHLSHSLFSR